MDSNYLVAAFARIQSQGIALEPGLTGSEIAALEQALHFVFPPDLRVLLQSHLPVAPGGGAPNWRSDPVEKLQKWLDWPRQGILYDVEKNGTWLLNEWGPKPEDSSEALALARRKLEETPVLVPLMDNQYLPAEPVEEGNPVFSVQQSELLLWGETLPSWLEKRFGVPNPYPVPETPRAIRFWSALLVG